MIVAVAVVVGVDGEFVFLRWVQLKYRLLDWRYVGVVVTVQTLLLP